MADVDLLLSIAIVAAVSINALTSLYVIQRLRMLPVQVPPDEEEPLKNEAEDDQGGQEDEGEPPDEEEAESTESVPSRSEIMARRTQLIRELEKERGSRVITLIHRKEPWSTDEDEPEIVLEDSELILQEVRETPPGTPIDFILHTEGGLAFAADLISIALKHHKGKVTVMIPFYAMSEGTYVALAAQEIMMERYSILAPLEPVLDDMPANSIIGILKRKPIEQISDRTILMAESARMELENAREFVKWLLLDKMPQEQVEQVASFLLGGFMASSTPITLDVARAIGLNVIEGVPEKVHQLFETIEFGGGKRPGKSYQ
jgi:ClpP class serine protease